ncbi:hypothetical protein, partial [Mesorhizobium ciceri]
AKPPDRKQILSPKPTSKTARQPQMPARRFDMGDCRSFSEYAGWSESEAEAAGQKNQIPSRKPNFTKQQPAWHQPAGCSRSRDNGARKRQSSAHKEDSADKVRQQTKPQQNSPRAVCVWGTGK